MADPPGGTVPPGGDPALHALLLDAAEQAIIATDLDGRILVWNRFAEVMYGWSAAEVTGRQIVEVTPSSATAAQARAIMTALGRGGSWRGEFEVRRKDGSTFTALVVNSPIIRDGDLIGVVGLSVDVSERLAAQAALLESEQRFREMADNLPVLIWQHDADGNHEWVNSTFCSFFGVSRDEMHADRRWRLTHPDDGRRHAREFLAATADHQTFHGEVRVRRADGTWRWMEAWSRPRIGADGTFLGILGTSTDVTERRLAEITLSSVAATNAYRARLADALRSSAEPATIVAAATGLLADHLRAARVMYVEVDQAGEYTTVPAEHSPGLDRMSDRHRWDDYGQDTMRALLAGQQVVVGDVRHGPVPARRLAGLGIGAYVLVPVVKQGRALAVVAVHDRQPRRWSPDEVTIVGDTAERCWAAVRQAREDRSLRVQHARRQLVIEVLSAMEGHHTVAAQAQSLTEALVPHLADFATVEAPGDDDFLLALTHHDPGKAQILRRLRENHRLGPGHPESLHTTATGSATLLNFVTEDVLARHTHLSAEARDLLAGLGTRSCIAVPLALSDTRPGALMIGITQVGRPVFGTDDVAFAEDLARRASVVLMSAHVRQQEHDIAVRLQRALLPDQVASRPGLDIEARYRAGDQLLEVGGDWYDTFTWPDGRVGVIVGDVAGHAMDAAIAMGRLRTVTGALATNGPADPAAVLELLDRYARGSSGTEFLTATCVIIDPASGRLAYSSAGHPPPLVLSPGRPAQRLQCARGQAVHRYRDGAPALTSAHTTVGPGSLIVMYSDGLIERRRSSLETGISRLEAIAAGVSTKPLPEVADRIIAGMTAGAPADDDIVLVCIRFAPPGPGGDDPGPAAPGPG